MTISVSLEGIILQKEKFNPKSNTQFYVYNRKDQEGIITSNKGKSVKEAFLSLQNRIRTFNQTNNKSFLPVNYLEASYSEEFTRKGLYGKPISVVKPHKKTGSYLEKEIEYGYDGKPRSFRMEIDMPNNLEKRKAAYDMAVALDSFAVGMMSSSGGVNIASWRAHLERRTTDSEQSLVPLLYSQEGNNSSGEESSVHLENEGSKLVINSADAHNSLSALYAYADITHFLIQYAIDSGVKIDEKTISTRLKSDGKKIILPHQENVNNLTFDAVYEGLGHSYKVQEYVLSVLKMAEELGYSHKENISLVYDQAKRGRNYNSNMPDVHGGAGYVWSNKRNKFDMHLVHEADMNKLNKEMEKLDDVLIIRALEPITKEEVEEFSSLSA